MLPSTAAGITPSTAKASAHSAEDEVLAKFAEALTGNASVMDSQETAAKLLAIQQLANQSTAGRSCVTSRSN